MKRSSFITWDQLRVGGLILVALALIVVAMYKLGKAANLFSRRYDLIAFLPNADGLRPGAEVDVAGQFAGTIAAIDFLPVDNDTTRNLRLRLAIDADLHDQVRRDSKARVRTLGLLGDKVIDISVGTPRYPALRAGDTITMVPALDYEGVLAQASGAVNDMVALTHDLRQLTGGLTRGQGTLGQLVTNRALYDSVTATLGRANMMMVQFQNPNGTFGRLLRDPALYERFVAVLGSADSLVVALNDKNGTLGRLVRDDTLYTRLVHMAASGDTILSGLSHGRGSAGKLLADSLLYDRAVKLTSDLDSLLVGAKHDPHRYFRGLICVIFCR